MHVTMDRYENDWNVVKRGWDAQVLGEVPHKFKSGLRTFACSETMKFGHAGMKALQISERARDAILSGKYDQVRVNLPNGDMVGHIGDMKATAVGCEAVDKAVKSRHFLSFNLSASSSQKKELSYMDFGLLATQSMGTAANAGCWIGNEEGCVCLAVPVPHDFSLQKAVCSYGFFMMAPNSWVFSTATNSCLERPLRLPDGRAVSTKIFESGCKLHICVLGVQLISEAEKNHISAQVSRMLRLSETESCAIAAFHALHLQAKEDGFGRLFRSPTLFEDMIKSLLLCNCGWSRTLTMARALCELQAELKGPPLGYRDKSADQLPWPVTPESREVKRKRTSKKRRYSTARRLLKLDETCQERTSHQEVVGRSPLYQEENVSARMDADLCGGNAPLSDLRAAPCQAVGAFPTPEELCDLDAKFLAKRCGLGYRAQSIVKLAKDICDGVVDLQSLENAETDPSLRLDARKQLLQIHGFGPFTSANILMCMGEYGIIPADTETVRHLKQVHGRSKCTSASVSDDVATLYAPFAPYQFLSYWFELWASYEQKFGRLGCMDPRCYDLFTGRNMRKRTGNTLESNRILDS
ncbi:hypothetical protein GOP47_0019532 [Adiantum capillus-veneris]|uniref:Metalloenzyme domain-containing protein n=1 Tax=Adiantum capillus-veneris TaxID=13818 RepID=A0A9D4Z8Q0_ADICA|nr:hypothetical protein GOP47_0019532 [Adiantum capillus-veneris]